MKEKEKGGKGTEEEKSVSGAQRKEDRRKEREEWKVKRV